MTTVNVLLAVFAVAVYAIGWARRVRHRRRDSLVGFALLLAAAFAVVNRAAVAMAPGEVTWLRDFTGAMALGSFIAAGIVFAMEPLE